MESRDEFYCDKLSNNDFDPTKSAFFDIDGTFKRKSLLISLVEKMIDRNLIQREDAHTFFALQKEDWEKRQGSFEQYIKGVVDAFATLIKGVLHDDYIQVCEEVVESEKDHVYVFPRKLSEALKNQKYFLGFISHSPEELVKMFAKTLGFHTAFGTRYEVVDGRFTGVILNDEGGFDKGEVLEKIMNFFGLELNENTLALGDTTGDISMLDKVQNPICINPNEGLLRHAKLRQYSFIVERKDVIYLHLPFTLTELKTIITDLVMPVVTSVSYYEVRG